MWSKISGYADATSIDLGESTGLHVSTGAPTWVVSAYRIGYYGGMGGRLVWRSDPQPGVVQPRHSFDAKTRTATAGWSTSLTIAPDPTWPPGQYLLRLESSDGGATFVPLVIRDDESRSDLLMQSAVTTWQAYNGWGGASIYIGDAGRADVVSFDRPYTGNGSGEFLGREYEFIFFVERLGLDVSYWTNIDLDERGHLATNHNAIIIPGHDEYYTVRMRKNLEKCPRRRRQHRILRRQQRLPSHPTRRRSERTESTRSELSGREARPAQRHRSGTRHHLVPRESRRQSRKHPHRLVLRMQPCRGRLGGR